MATPVLLVGGTEVQMMAVSKILAGEGYRVVVCCYYESDDEIVNEFEKGGIEVLQLGLDRKIPFVSRAMKLIGCLHTIFKRYQPGLVHVQYLTPGLLPIVAARLSGVPVVLATVHIAGNTVYRAKAKALLRISSWLCNAFICVSVGVERFWFGKGSLFTTGEILNGRKHVTIYNAVDTWAIRRTLSTVNHEELLGRLGINGGSVIGIVGRLSSQKGHGILLDAMVTVLKKVPDAMLLVIGEGPERGVLESRAMELGISKHVRWLGKLPHLEVMKLYSIMNVLAMPSFYEGFGLTAAEAMAAGLPVVGTRVEGLSEIVDEGVTGLAISTGDIQGLALSLTQLLLDPEMAKQMGAMGCRRAAELFSMEKFKNNVLAVYAELTSAFGDAGSLKDAKHQ